MAEPAISNTPSSGPAIGELHELRGFFDSSDRMSDAAERLSRAGFDRADLSIPEVNPPTRRSTPESGAKEVDTEEDARQARTLHTSTAASVAALAAAGLAVGTGGAALPVIAAAVGAGAAVGGATFAITKVADDTEQQDRDIAAAQGKLILSVRAPTPEKRTEAEEILRSAGATEVVAI